VAAMAQFVGKDAQIAAPPLAGHDLAQTIRQGLRHDIAAIGFLKNKTYTHYS